MLRVFLKKTFSFLFQQKRSLFLILFLTAFFFIFRFPLNQWVEKSLKDLQKKSPITQDLAFDDLKIKWFPPELLFKDISFVYKDKISRLDSAVISISLKHWIAFKKAFNFKLRQGQSHLFVNFQQKLVLPDEEYPIEATQQLYLIKGSSSLINLKDLAFLYPNMSGKLNTRFSYKGSVQDIKKMTGELSLSGKNVSLSELQLNTVLGPLNLPPIKWTKLELNLRLKEGELVFKKTELGSSKDKLRVKMRGSGAFNYFRGRFRLSSYNIELQVDMNEKMEFGFLDLMFASHKEKKSNFHRYSVRLIGKGSQVPKIEKLEKF